MPEKTDVLLGGTKRFECRVIGYPRPEIKWYKDGVEITSNKRYNFTFSREGVISMLIQQVSRQDEGCYRCRASNSEGMASTAAYLFVRTKKSKFLDDTPSVHSMSFGEATEKDLELDKEFKTKQMKQRQEEESMETEEYEHKITMETEEFEHRITMEEQSDILKGRELSDDVISGSLEQTAVTLTEITSESESSFSSMEQMKGSKDTQDQLEKVAKMYEDVVDSEKKMSVEIETKFKTESKEESLTIESEVSIEEKKSKKVEISSEVSTSVTKEVSMTSSEEKFKIEEEIRKKEEQLSDLMTQGSTEVSEMEENQGKGETKSRLDVSVEVEETKTKTQTADDSGLGLSFTADMEEKSFVEQNDSLIATSSSEVDSKESSQVEITTKMEESSKVEEKTQISTEVKTETTETKQEESKADILEGPSEPDKSLIPDSKSETATSSLGPESGVFSMSLQDEVQVIAEGSSVDSVENLSSAEGAKAIEGQAEGSERMPTFVNFEQRVSESEVKKTVESTETLQETETTFVSKTEEEKSEAKKSQDAFMADGVSEEKVPTDDVQSLDASDAENATANIKVEEGNQQQLINQPSIEALIEQASLDDIAALADLQTMEGDDKSAAGESLTDAAEVQKAEREQAVESQSDVTEITQSEDNLSEISEVPETEKVKESKQQQEMGSERAEVIPDELVLQADANVGDTEVKPGNLLVDAEVDVEEKRGDDTLVLRADVDTSEEKYAQEEDGLKMSATVETEQVVFTPKITQVPEDVAVQPGETIQLVSEVQGSPAPEVKWFKEGDTVKPTDRISLLANNDIYTLEIREATGSDAGTYTLTAHNSEGTIFSDVQVTVNVPQDQGAVGGATGGEDVSVTATLSAPEFIIMPEDASVQEFEQLQVFCSVKGTPTPEVKWQREGQTLQADSRMRIFESDGCHFLEIPQASFLDSGEYECIATNSEGTVSVVIILTVEGVTDIDESGLSTNEDLRVAMSERSDTDVSNESATRRYIKLVGAAAAFTLVAFGINKIVQVLPKGS